MCIRDSYYEELRLLRQRLPPCWSGQLERMVGSYLPLPEFSQFNLASLPDVLSTPTPPEGEQALTVGRLFSSAFTPLIWARLAPVLNLSRLIRCGSLSLRPVCSCLLYTSPSPRDS